MIFYPCCLDLVHFAESKNVISNDILPAVMLMKAAGFCMVNQVILHFDMCRTLIRIESPASVIIGIDVMNMVIGNLSPFRNPEGINPGHVT